MLLHASSVILTCFEYDLSIHESLSLQHAVPKLKANSIKFEDVYV